jgi:hypothetical protein
VNLAFGSLPTPRRTRSQTKVNVATANWSKILKRSPALSTWMPRLGGQFAAVFLLRLGIVRELEVE